MDVMNFTKEKLLGLLKLNPDPYYINELSDKLKSFETDEERISFLRQLTPLIHEDFLSLVPTEIKLQGHKSVSKSLELRRKGNAMFHKKDYHSAIVLYTESVALAPYPSYNLEQSDCPLDSETESALSLALSNRSAALFELKKYVSCLKDISFALKMNYPRNLLYKLYIRQLKCFKFLNSSDKGITLNLAMQSLSLADNITEDKKQALKEEIQSLAISNFGDDDNGNEQENVSVSAIGNEQENVSVSAIGNEQENVSVSAITIKPSYGPNVNLPGYSNCIEMKLTPDMGRGLFATRDIEIGDIIATLKPFACVLYDDFIYKNCHHCLKKCSTLIPCYQCSVVLFCSENCLHTAWESYHSIECKILPLLKYKLFPSAIITLRIVIIAANMFESLPKFYEATKSFDLFRQNNDWYPRTILDKYFDYYQVYEPVKNNLEVNGNYIIGTYLSLVLEKGTDFYSKHFLEEGKNGLLLDNMKNFIACLLMSQLGSAQPVVQYVVEEWNTIEIGEATYPKSVYLINHSCNPNCFRYHDRDSQLVVRALSPIKAGEQLFISYGKTYSEASLKDRQTALLSKHSFVCHCVACTENWPIKSELIKQESRFKCEFCTSELQLTQKPPETVVCGICHRKNDLSMNIPFSGDRSEIFQIVKFASTHLVEPNFKLLLYQQALKQHIVSRSFDDED